MSTKPSLDGDPVLTSVPPARYLRLNPSARILSDQRGGTGPAGPRFPLVFSRLALKERSDGRARVLAGSDPAGAGFHSRPGLPGDEERRPRLFQPDPQAERQAHPL